MDLKEKLGVILLLREFWQNENSSLKKLVLLEEAEEDVADQKLESLEGIALHYVRLSHAKVQCYCEETVLKYHDVRFKEHFRLQRSTFDILLNYIKGDAYLILKYFPHEESLPDYRFAPSNSPVSVRKTLLVAIWYLANKTSMRDVGDRFGISKSCVHACVHKICELLTEKACEFIKWPDHQECARIASSFESATNFPGCVGLVDGCHIPVQAPADQRASYTNRKCGYSIVLQGICDASKKFTNIFVGYPGSVHDARVFKNSGLYQSIENLKKQMIPDGMHLLGDSAYPNLEWILAPYKNVGSMTVQKMRYNKRHSRTRVSIEHSFGVLKSRFRKLQMVDVCVEFVPKVVTSCCVLHNICTMNSDAFDDLDNPSQLNHNTPQLASVRSSRTGTVKRDHIASSL